MSKGWGGARRGAGRKKVTGDQPGPIPTATPDVTPKVAAEAKKADTAGINLSAVADIIAMSRSLAPKRADHPELNPFQLPSHPARATPPKNLQMAADSALVSNVNWAAGEWAGGLLANVAAEGLLFLGYPYLAELAQRPEYRVISETIADDATRKWIEFDVTGDEKENEEKAAKDPVGEAERMADPDERKKRVEASGKMDKVKALKDDQERLQAKEHFYSLCRDDGLFGRSHLYHCFGEDIDGDDQELATPIGDGRDALSRAKIAKGSLKRLQVIEAVWTYPTTYNALNPLREDWYNPQVWYVLGKQIHVSRMPFFIGRPVPDLLKPAYSFGGLSLSQMAKPYVDIWLTTRQSVADLIHSFSVMVLSTDLSTILQPGNAGNLMARVALFNALRDNQGTFVINKNTEDFKNVTASLSGLADLQAQAQEHLSSVSRIPLVKLTGISPKGLNASSEGEIMVYDDTIGAYQNRVIRPALSRLINFEQLSLWGDIDPEITFHFADLRVLTEKERGEKQKADAERHQTYVDMGAIAPEEVRAVIIDDDELPYTNLNPEDVPDLAAEEEEGLEPAGGRPDPKADGEPDKSPGGEGGAQDLDPFGASDAAEWKEGEHPRAPDGKFGSGGGSSSTKQTLHAPQYGLIGGKLTASHGSFSSGFAPAPKRGNIGAELDPKTLKKVGAQMGSNEGGVFEDADGARFYVKKGKSKDHVKNEMIAAALYDLAGAPTLQYRTTPGGGHIATEMAKLDKDNAGALSKREKLQAQEDFAVHAWLGNWDAAGLTGDNIGTVKGVPTSLDLGGALEYRAQGAPKGKAFGDKVGEIDTLRDPDKNAAAAKLFGDMTPADMRAAARRVTSIPDAKIRARVEKMGGDAKLADKLIARKADIAQQAQMFGAEGDPKDATGTMVVPTGAKTPLKTLNGVKFAPWRPPGDWNAVDGQGEFPEPEFEPAKGKRAATGVIIREPDGRVWLIQPRGGFGGYEATFPKGGIDEGLSPQANAIKEAYEESGLKVRLTGHAGDAEGDTSTTRYYYAEREGGDPSLHGDESEGVVLAPKGKLPDFLNRDRDVKIAKGIAQDGALDSFEESKHPRDKDGKFAETSGGGAEGEEILELTEPVFKTKKEHAGHLLEKGATTKQLLTALNWPSMNVPAMAKSLGMKLEKTKKGGETFYKATKMSDAEKAATVAPAPKPAAPAAPPKPAAKPEPKLPQSYEDFAKFVKDPKSNPEIVAGLKKYNPTWVSMLESEEKKAAPAKPAFPPPTAAELEKAKKNVPLQLQFLGVPDADPTSASVQAPIKWFNAKYEGKTLADHDALVQKVNDFKTVQLAVAGVAGASAQNKIAQQQAAAAKQAEANKAAADALKKAKTEAAAKNKQYMDALGISDTEAVGFSALVDMIGGSGADIVAKFKRYEESAKKLGYPISGFQYALIRNYINGGYSSVNEALRSGKLTPAQHVYTRMVNNALEKLPKYEGTVTRGTTLSPQEIAKYVPGHVVPEPAFTSTGIGFKFSGNVHYNIKSIGKRGADFSKGANPGEKEVLFKANTFFLVHKVETKGGNTYIDMEEVEGHG